MAASKVALLPINYKSFALIHFFKQNGRMLIERKYSCQVVDLTGYVLPHVRPSLRVWGYLSSRLEQVFTRWIEIGWLQKVMQLSNNVNNLKLQLQGVDAVVLDRFPPSHALSLWTFIGLVAVIHCGLGLTMLILLLSANAVQGAKSCLNLTIRHKVKVFA